MLQFAHVLHVEADGFALLDVELRRLKDHLAVIGLTHDDVDGPVHGAHHARHADLHHVHMRALGFVAVAVTMGATGKGGGGGEERDGSKCSKFHFWFP